jgi:hypothetical protein
MAGKNVVQTLQEAGIQLKNLSEAQREVIARLSEEEAGVLVSVKRLLDAAAPDVQAHDLADGGIFW